MKIKLHILEGLLIIAILVQSFAIIFVYESMFQIVSPAMNNTNEVLPNNFIVNASSLSEIRKAHVTPNPGGLILASSFSYMQDPREVWKERFFELSAFIRCTKVLLTHCSLSYRSIGRNLCHISCPRLNPCIIFTPP